MMDINGNFHGHTSVMRNIRILAVKHMVTDTSKTAIVAALAHTCLGFGLERFQAYEVY
jgi:hypothetical protein